MRYLFVLALGLWGGGLAAMPLTFTSSLYQTTAFAQVGPTTDASDSNPSSSLPLLTTAAAADGDDQADAAGTADTGFLGTAAEAASVLQPAAALASAEFSGDFVASGGPLLLTLDFDSQLLTSSNGLAANTLLVRLTGNGVTLLEELFSATELITRAVALPAGPVQGTLDLLLTSNAEATDGDALGVATVSNFALAVPEPPVWALLTAGLALVGLRRRGPAPPVGLEPVTVDGAHVVPADRGARGGQPPADKGFPLLQFGLSRQFDMGMARRLLLN